MIHLFNFSKENGKENSFVCEVPSSRLLLQLPLPLNSHFRKAVPHNKASGNVPCTMQTLIKQKTSHSYFFLVNETRMTRIVPWFELILSTLLSEETWFKRKKLWGNQHTWNSSGKGQGNYIPTISLIYPDYNWYKLWSENTEKMYQNRNKLFTYYTTHNDILTLRELVIFEAVRVVNIWPDRLI